jgi:hypothetical protein
MDGRASQYVAHLSAQNCRVEMVFALRDAMVSLLNQFKERNGGKIPAHIIVYRDGVSDGQFDQVMFRCDACIHVNEYYKQYCPYIDRWWRKSCRL